MPHKLVDLEIDEISGVDRPATRRKFLIIKRQGEPMPTAYAQFCELVEVEILKSEADGKPMSFADAAAVVNSQHSGLYAQAVTSTPAAERQAPEPVHITRETTSGTTMLMFAKRLLVDGEAKTMGDALAKVHQQHPSLYRQHREGK